VSQAADPALQYETLKDLHLNTPLVSEGRPTCTVVAPADGAHDSLARDIQAAVQRHTGVEIPVAADTVPAAVVPLAGHVILLGNRSTNRAIEELYNRHFCLLDLRYPGPGGHVLRSVHNPFGNGCNAILVGGSDDAGVAAATGALCAALARARANGDQVRGDGPADLSLGWLMDIVLGAGMDLPAKLRDYEIWEASAGYGSVGYFGWNSLSKRLAAYYMTGDPEEARQFLRLAFPDEEARAEIAELDGERVENKDEPLAGPYHYNAHMMILYWDLVEESPVFSDADRLRVTNAFARQFFHAEDRVYRRSLLENSQSGAWPYDVAPPHVGSRHGQWSAISMYCLCRYFQRDYPAPLWQHGMAAAQQHFASLKEHAWVGGENDNLFWFCTGVAPILSYLLLTGEREPLDNGNLPRLLEGLDMLISGREPDWALNSASMGFLHKAAYLTGNGRFLEYARRTGVEREALRLGQSYWAPPELAAAPPAHAVGKWSIHPVPEPMWRTRTAGLPHDESFLFGSFRSAADHTGDFLLIKGLNGASRNAYHTFAVLEARLDGDTVLAGFSNQVRVTVGGAVEARVAMDAALRHRAVAGQMATVTAAVPHAPFCSWERVVLQQVGQCLVLADRLQLRCDAPEAEVELWWEGDQAWSDVTAPGCLAAGGTGQGRVDLCDRLSTELLGKRARMVWRGPVRDGQELVFLSLVHRTGGGDSACERVSPTAALARLAEPALVVSGAHEEIEAGLAMLSAGRISGTGVRRLALPAGTGDDGALVLLEASAPVDVDWDLEAGRLDVSADAPVELQVSTTGGDSPSAVSLAAGQHCLADAVATGEARGALAAYAARLAQRPALTSPSQPAQGDDPTAAGRSRPRDASPTGPAVTTGVPPLPIAYAVELGSSIADLVSVESTRGTLLAAATGASVHLLDPDGASARILSADGPVRVLRWWPEADLLLAGCADEQVIAFDPVTGERAWVFTSQMDEAVWRAAKTYWFKSQPGHEGVHGLHTGAFLEHPAADGTQAFVGSACTLEILDSAGHLLERLPVFWGPGTQFRLIPGPTGAPRLLLAREPTDSHALAVIDRDALDGAPRGYSGVPEGHSDIGGWACMSRDHIFYADVDGDGQPEVVSEINGTWNRLTVWAADGTPKCNLQLGPGDAIPARHVRDLELVDVNDDGLPEIVAALASGLVLAANGQCEPLWSRRLESAPTRLAAGPWPLVVACEDGTALALNGAGVIAAEARVGSAATRAVVMRDGVALGTAQGRVIFIEPEA